MAEISPKLSLVLGYWESLVVVPIYDRDHQGFQHRYVRGKDTVFKCHNMIFVLDPPDLPHYCDVCNANFYICHALDCKRGGLVTARHNELRDGVADLASKVFTPSHVRDDPLIFAGCAVNRLKVKLYRTTGTTVPDNATPLEATELTVGLLIHDLWQNGTDSVHNMRVVNTYAKSHSENPP